MEGSILSSTLKKQVYESISNKIQLGEIFPNERVSEVAIAKEMGISRTPVREALIQLISDGFLEKTRDKGIVIREYTMKDKYDTFQIIGALDGLAASLAVNKLTEEDILKMEELTEKIDVAIKYYNYQDYGKLKQEFHLIYINKCDNIVLIDLLNSMINNFMPKTYYNKDTEKLFSMLSNYSNREHKELVQLFKAKDTPGIIENLKQHWKIVDEEFI